MSVCLENNQAVYFRARQLASLGTGDAELVPSAHQSVCRSIPQLCS